MPIEIQRFEDDEGLAIKAARDLAVAIAEARAERGVAHVALAGGTTPLRTYELLSQAVRDWSHVHIWYSDERCVPFDDPQSNHGQVTTRLRARNATWHPMPATLGPTEGALEYTRELGQIVLDVCHLGLGEDGHTASLFPHSPQLDSHEVAVAVTEAPKPPPERISLTLPKINQSRRIVLMAAGEGKSDALAGVRAGADRAVPASLLDRTRLVVMADQAAMPA